MHVAGERRALDEQALAAALERHNCGDVTLEVRPSVTSTNDLVNRPAGTWALLTADEQVAGRGRAGRQWSSPWAAGIAMSLWVPLDAVRCPLSALPLVAGLGARDALADLGAAALLKWPNDVLLDDRKVGGILVQLHPDGAVVGIGVNTDVAEHELPTPQATSLRLAGVDAAREDVIAAIAAAVRTRVTAEADWVADYRSASATIGRDVRVELVGGGEVVGTCTDVSVDGALLLACAEGEVTITVGDVHHLRSTG